MTDGSVLIGASRWIEDPQLTCDAFFIKIKTPEVLANYVSVAEQKNETSINIYPNPTTGQLTINSEQSTINNVEIFDVYGRKLLSHIANLTPHTVLNISHLPTGIYFVKIRTVAGEVIKKVLKE